MVQIRLYNLSKPHLYRASEKMFAGYVAVTDSGRVADQYINKNFKRYVNITKHHL